MTFIWFTNRRMPKFIGKATGNRECSRFLPYAEWVIVCRPILLVAGGEEIDARLAIAEIKSDRNPFPAVAQYHRVADAGSYRSCYSGAAGKGFLWARVSCPKRAGTQGSSSRGEIERG